MILETDLSFSCARKVYLYFIKHWMYLASKLANFSALSTIYLCCYPRLFSFAIAGLNFFEEK